MDQQDFNESIWKKVKDAIYHNDRLDSAFDQHLSQVLSLLQKLQQDADSRPRKQISYFMNELFPSVISSLLNKKPVPESTPVIFKIRDTLLLFLNFFLKNIQLCNSKFFDSVIKIFDQTKNIYSFQDPSCDQVLKIIQFGEIVEDDGFFEGIELGDSIGYLHTIFQRKSWCKATILQMNPSHLQIQIHNTEEQTVWVQKNRSNFQKEVPKDFEWRMEIKEGDMVDYQDSADHWSQIQVQGTKWVEKPDSEKIFQIQLDKGSKCWSFNYVDWVNTSNPRVQPLGSMADFYLTLDNYDDSQDQIIYGPDFPQKYVICRREHNYPLFVHMINEFGRTDGFQKIFLLVNVENQSLDFMAQMLPALAGFYTMYFYPFAKKFIQELQEIVYKQVLKSSDNNLRNIQKESLENIISALIKLQKRNCDPDKPEKQESFFMKTAIMFLSSQFLDKQVFGLKQIIEIISNLKNKKFQYINNSLFQQALQEGNVFEKIFGSKSHTQLIEKSADFIRYYFREEIMDPSKLEILMKSTQTSVIQQKLAIYKIINDVSYEIRQDETSFIIRKLMHIKKLTVDEINLVYELGRLSNKQDSIISEITDFFFHTYCNKFHEKELKKIVMQRIQEFFRNSNFKQTKLQILEKCIEHIKSHTKVIPSLKFFKKVVQTYQVQKLYDWDNEKSSQAEIIQDFQENQDLLTLIINDIVYFKEKIAQSLDATAENIDQISQSRSKLSYLQNLEIRIKLITFCINLHPKLAQALSPSIPEQLWSILVKEPLISQESYLFFTWYQIYAQKQIDLQPISDFFEQVMLPEMPRNLKIHDCYITVFLLVNSFNKYLNLQTKNLNPPYPFTLVYQPDQLIGLSQLWELFYSSQECKNLTSLLTQIYLYPVEIEKRQSFLDRIVQSFKQQNCMKKMVNILFAFINESESEAYHPLQNHIQLLPSKQVTITYEYSEKHSLQIENHQTLLQLKQRIGENLKIGWRFLGLETENGTQLQDHQHGLTIEDLRICHLKVKKLGFWKERVEIIDEDGVLVPKVIKIFERWFKEYSTEGTMSMEQCAEFIASCTHETCAVTDSRIISLFQKFDKDADGYLNLEDFLDFYTHSANQRVQVVWSNLNAKHITNDLRDETENEIEEVDPELLPRIMLTKSNEIYEILFQKTDESNFHMIQKLLNRIPTSKQVVEDLSNLNQIQNPSHWNKLLNLKNKYYLLYQLQVLESFLYKTQDFEWIQNFICKGGFPCMLDLFAQVYSQLKKQINRHLIQVLLNIIKSIFIPAIQPLQQQSIYTALFCDHFSKYPLNDLSEILDQINKQSVKRKRSSFDQEADTPKKSQKNSPFQESNALVTQERDENQIIGDAIQPYRHTLFFASQSFEFFLQVYNLFSNLILQDFITQETRHIINVSLTFVNTLLIQYPKCQDFFNQHLMKGFIQLLFDKKPYIRKLTKTTLYILCRLTSNTDFAFYILEKLIDLLENSNDQQDWCYYYELLGQLLDEIELIQSQKNKEKINSSRLFDVILAKMCVHESQEKKSSSPQDKMLYGYINLSNHLLHLNAKSLENKNEDFASKFFTDFLFDFDIDAQIQDNMDKDMQGKVKCKHIETRKAAYKLLLDILTYSKPHLDHFVNSSSGLKQIQNQISQFIDKYSTGQNRNQRENFTGNYIKKGLFNMRNICYINSVLQQLYMNSTLRNTILKLDTPIPKSVPLSNNYYNGILKDGFLYQLQKTFSFLQATQRAHYDPYALCYSIKDFDQEPIDVNIQEDANEFSNKVFDLIEQETKNTIFSQVLQGIYQGSLHIVKICQNCGYKRNQEDFFYNLILEVKNLSTLSQSLKKFVEGEVLDGVTCDECNQKAALEKHQYFQNLPNTLMIQLQRFSYDFDNAMALTKINTKVEFPQKLDMAPFLYEQDQQDTIYELKGVILHTGYAQAGHYRSLIKEEDIWYIFDDKSVRQLFLSSQYNVQNFERDCFGGDNTQGQDWQNWQNQNLTNAYILIYEKQTKNPIELVFQNEIQMQDTQIAMDLQFIQHINKDDKIYSQIDYDSLSLTIPKDFKGIIWKDNFKYMIEQHILYQDFFTFIKEINFLHYKNDDKMQADRNLLNLDPFVHKLHDTLSFQEKDTYSNLCHSLMQLLQIFTNHSRDYHNIQNIMEQVKYFLSFIPELMGEFFRKYIHDNEYFIMKEAMTHESDVIRRSYFVLTQQIINILIEYYQFNYYDSHKYPIQLEVEMFIINLLKNIDLEGQRNILKMTEYFQFFNEFIQCTNPYNLQLLSNFDMVSIFIDYYLQKDSPLAYKNSNILDNSNKFISYDGLILCICNLLKKVKPEDLSQNDNLCLQSSALFKKLLLNNQNNKDTGNLMQKICYNNINVTKMFGELLLLGLNSINGDEVHPYLNYFFDYLLISDEYTLQRWEWILGFPQLILRNDQPILQDKQDQSYDYQTYLPVFNSSNEKCVSILSMIYQNRKKHSTKSILLINKMLQVVDFNHQLGFYLSDLEPGVLTGIFFILDGTIFEFFRQLVESYQEGQKCMMYNMEGFTRLDHDGLVKDTQNLLDHIHTKQDQKFYRYGQFKNSTVVDIQYLHDDLIIECIEQEGWILPLEADSNETQENNFMEKFIMNQQKPQQVMDFSFSSQNTEDDSESIVKLNNCLRLIYIENKTNNSYCIDLSIDQGNGRVPQSVTYVSNFNSKQLVLIIQKLEQHEEWGSLTFNYSFQETQEQIEQDTNVALTPSTGDFYGMKVNFSNQKQCQNCFEENDVQNSFCINCYQDFANYNL